MLFRLISLLLFLLPLAAMAQPAPPAPNTEMWVTAPSGLALRKGPSPQDERIHFIPKGDKIRVLENPGLVPAYEFEGIRGFWIRVRHGYLEGYVFSGYLTAQQPAAKDRLDWLAIPSQRVGPITAQTAYADLETYFGKINLKETEIHLGEGEFIPGTAVFPGTPDEIRIRWAEFAKRVDSVVIDKAGGKWRTESGISIGMPLRELARVNGAPVSFTGFEWDYAGTVVDWNKGVFAEPAGLRVRLDCRSTNQEAYMSVLGDDTFRSDMPAVQRLDIVVSEITVAVDAAPQPGTAALPAYPNALASQPAPPAGSKWYTLATRLNLRKEPRGAAEVVARLPYGALVTIADGGWERSPLEADGLVGHWVKVTSMQLSGYVFDAYLSPYEAPPAATTGLWHYADLCLGKSGQPKLQASGNPQQGKEISTEAYATGARVESEKEWDATATRYRITLTLKGVSPEQAFFLARACEKGFDDARFAMDKNGLFEASSPTGKLIIASRPDGTVAITHAHEVRAR